MSIIVAGSETRVNTFTASNQSASSVTVLQNGNYVVTWQSFDQDSTVNLYTASGVYSQLYSASGAPIGGEVLVNTYTSYAQTNPRAVSLSNGGYLIVWQSEGQDGYAWGVYAQRFSSSGVRVGGEFRINSGVVDNQYQPDIAVLANGDYVVSWTHGLNPQSHSDIYMRHLTSAGASLTGDVLVNSTTAGNQDNSKVVALSDGGYLVLWQSYQQDGSDYGLYARRYSAAGVAQPEFRINTTTTGEQSQASVVRLGDGGLIVAWRSLNQDGSGYGIILQRYNAQGQAMGGEVVVNTTTADAQTQPTVVALGDGGYVVGWSSANQDGSGLGVYAQRFDAGGGKLGGEFLIAQTTQGDQQLPAFAATADGGWIATWTGFNPANGTLEVMQRHFTPANITVAVDAIDRILTTGQPVAATSLFSVVADIPVGTNVVIQKYEFTDLSAGKGHFLLDGEEQPVGTPILLTGEQLNRLTYVAGGGAGDYDTIRVRVFDGVSWAEDSATLAATAPEATIVASPETRVNTFTASNQSASSVTVLQNGNYVVTWQSFDQDSTVNLYTASGVYSQLYSASGAPIGGEVLVNTYTSYAQTNPRAVSLSNGGYLIVWQSEGQDGYAWGVYAQYFSANGVRVGAEFRINSGVVDNQYQPDIAVLANGDYVVSWTHGLNPQSHSDIYMRRLTLAGASLTGDVLVNTTTAGNQDNSKVVALSDGGYLVLWQSYQQDGSDYGLYARRYSAAGVAQPEFRINTTTTGEQSQASVALLGDGGLVVAWRSLNQDGSGYGIILQRYNAQGQAMGGEVVVNTTTADAQTQPTVVALGDGGYVVGWSSANQDGSGLGVYAQRFDAGGGKLGGEFLIAQTTQGDQQLPAFAATADGGWIATWTGFNQANGTSEVMQRHFTPTGLTPAVVTIDGSPQDDLLYGTPLWDHISGYAGDDQIFGSASADVLDGGSGNDWLDGGAGADTMIGGTGNDVFIVDNTGDSVIEQSGQGTDEVRTTLPNYVLGYNIENLTFVGNVSFTGTGNGAANSLFGGSGNDTLYGMDGDDSLTGYAGNDWLDGGTGADTLIGGIGNDTYIVDQAGDIVTELAGQGTDTVRTGLTSYTLSANVENLVYIGSGPFTATGNDLDNTLTGGAGADLLTGLDGNDRLNGGAGADTLVGGLGNDSYVVDNASDVVTELVGEGIDTVNASINWTLGANIENLTLTGSATINATGNELNNVLTGNSGANLLDGGLGSDSMAGGTGNDVYIVDDAGDVVTELAGQGTDEVRTSLSSYLLGANVEVLTYTGTGDFAGTGNALDNLLTGGLGNDTLSGGDGADTLDGGAGSNLLIGGAGNDVYLVGGFGDQVVELAGEGIDEVRTALTGYTLTDGVETLTYTGASAFAGTGNGLDNLITGGAGADTLDGGLGADTLIGGFGDDVYVVDSVGDTVIEGVDAGIDEVRTTLSAFTLGDNVERLVFQGGGDASGVGNWLDNWLAGNAGNDTLDGAAGNDTLLGSLGNDVLTGGSGADLFAFAGGDGQDTITDFDALQGDRIGLTAGQSYSVDTNANGDAMIVYGTGDIVTLAGIQPVAVSSTWFVTL